jgi:hypothetical protein
MIGFIRPCLVSGVAVLGASALAVTPVTPPPTRPEPPPIALAALAQPLAAPMPVASVQPFDLVGQQVSFHVGFVADFVVTGAQLVARQLPIPGTLLQDIQNGTPLPVAVGRALQTFADVEIDAGRELVGFATEYVNFQIDFLTKVLRDVMTTVSNTTIAFAAFAVGVVGQLVNSMTSVAAGLTPASTQAVPTSAEPVSVGLAPASARQTTPPAATERRSDGRAIETMHDSTRTASTAEDTVTEQPKNPKPAISAVEAVDAPQTVTESTVSGQGEVRTATTGTTGTDGVAAKDRDGATQANKGGNGEARSKPDAAPEDKGDTDTAPQKDSGANEKP